MDNPFDQSPVFLYDTVESTMTKAKELYSQEKRAGVVVVARHQSSGRGRIDKRRWFDAPGEALLFTLIVEPHQIAFPPEQLPLRVGIALSHAIEGMTGLKATIKWPNDILIGDKKVCGILCESTFTSFSIGIGINVKQQGFPDMQEKRLLRIPTSLALEGTVISDPIDILPQVLSSLYWAFKLKDWKEYVEQRLYRLGEMISIVTGEATEDGKVSPSGNMIVGRLVGLDTYGGLLIENETGTTVWYSGEYYSGL